MIPLKVVKKRKKRPIRVKAIMDQLIGEAIKDKECEACNVNGWGARERREKQL